MNPRTPPPADVIHRIRENIHPDAHWSIDNWETFPWHKGSDGVPDTYLRRSSQALCISVWGTLARPDGDRARETLASVLGDPMISGVVAVAPELRFEFVDADVLNEKGSGNPTNVDALLVLPGLVVVVESKFTERFGSCSQVSSRQCTGRYEEGSDLKTRTDALCRLSIADGRRTPRRYWDVMRSLGGVDSYLPGGECPFAGPGYQVMRNVAFAAEYAERKGSDWRTIFAFPEALSPKSSQDIDSVVSPLKEQNRKRVLQLDYQRLAIALADGDDPMSTDLSRYILGRIGDRAD